MQSLLEVTAMPDLIDSKFVEINLVYPYLNPHFPTPLQTLYLVPCPHASNSDGGVVSIDWSY